MATQRWWISVAEARAVQESLRAAVVRTDEAELPVRVAGLDVGISRCRKRLRAAVAVFTFPGLELIESTVALRPLQFPYVPGYLSFREIPVALDALEQLTLAPQMILCDGHGLAHPRRCGLACHLGLSADVPTIGVGKTRLTGVHGPVPARRGQWTPLVDPKASDEIIGAVVRSRAGVAPIYVSIGHRVGLERAVRIVMGCVTRYRLPETTRAADRLAAWT